MSNVDLNHLFLETIKKSFRIFLNTHSRSNEKLKELHSNVKSHLLEKMKKEGIDIQKIKIISLDKNNKEEDKICGRYYEKKVDISIRNEMGPIGAIGLKFVMNNYKQNSNNYFENMLGETANIRSANLPYFQIFILFDKMPYFESDGNLKYWEDLSRSHLDKYIRLSEDNIERFYHTPNLTLFCIISLSLDESQYQSIKSREEFRIRFNELLDKNELEMKYSSKFPPEIFKQNVILNDYNQFLNRVIYYLLANDFLKKGEINEA